LPYNKYHMTKHQEVDLLDRIIDGDPKALEQLGKAIDKAQGDEEIKKAVDEFDNLAMLYVMGRPNDPKNEWHKFREVVTYFRRWQEHLSNIDDYKESSRRNEFEVEVARSLLENPECPYEPEFRELVEMDKYGQEMAVWELGQEERKAGLCEAWLDEARKHFTDRRFTDLSDELFDELVEVVSHELGEVEEMNSKPEDTDDGEDEEEGA
jgi:hypothetical protein